MTYAEAQRQYQATLEARRAAYDNATLDEAEAMDAELVAAEHQRDVAWLHQAVR